MYNSKFTKHYNNKTRTTIELMQKTISNPDYVAYTDGSCWHERYDTSIGRGGYGTILIKSNSQNHTRLEYSEGFELTTINRMELMAIIRALEETPNNSSLRIKSDSQYCIGIMKGIKTQWKNDDLWDKYYQLINDKSIAIDPVWIKGHNNDKNNDRADMLAKKACKSASLNHDIQFEKCSTAKILHYNWALPKNYSEKNYAINNPQVLVSSNNINLSCAKLMVEFWNISHKDEFAYGNLVVGKNDTWSKQNFMTLVSNCPSDVVSIAKDILTNHVKEVLDLPDIERYQMNSIISNALRWYLRGLSLYDSICKAGYDYEIFTYNPWCIRYL